jgi:hypothetical protein
MCLRAGTRKAVIDFAVATGPVVAAPLDVVMDNINSNMIEDVTGTFA